MSPSDSSTLNYRWINPDLKGPVLLFLHHGLGSIKQWKNFPDLLCNSLNLSGLIYDRQGHGQSPELTTKRDETYLEQYALDELPRFLKSINIQRPLILIGHSDGGTIALIFASKFPNLVQGVITEAAHIYVEQITGSGIKKVIETFETKTEMYLALEHFHGSKVNETFYAWADTWILKNRKNWNVSSYLNDVQPPLLALQGEDDEFATEQHLKDIVSLSKGNTEFKLIKKCRHAPHEDQEEEVLDLMSNFIKSIINE